MKIQKADYAKCYITASELNKIHDALFNFVERVAKGKATEAETAVLPQVASVLVDLAKLHS